MKFKKNQFWLTVAPILFVGLLFLLFCCGVIARYSERVHLVGNYYYLRTPDGITVYYDMQEYSTELRDRLKRGWEPPKVGPDVDGYRVYRRVIVGHVAGTQGYFILDPHSDTLQKGLSKRDWLEKLRGYGVKREPELFKPAWYDEVLGRNRVCDE